jgi:Zn-finger nucleic acid-binding protein
MLSFQEYKDAEAAQFPRQWRGVWAMGFVLFFGIYVVPLGFVWLFRPDREEYIQAFAEWIVSHGVAPRHTLPIALLIIVPIGLVLAIPSVLVLEVIHRYMRPNGRLLCPRCNGPLNSFTAVTGNCPQCGGRAVDNPEADRADEHSSRPASPAGDGELVFRVVTIEEFDVASRNRRLLRDPKQLDPRLKCPQCQADLYSRRSYILATRRCPRCATPVLEDPENHLPADDSSTEDRRTSLAHFRMYHAAYCRWVSFGCYLLLLALVLLWVPHSLVACWKGPLQRMVGLSGVEVLDCAALPLFACVAITMVWLVHRRLLRKLHMGCPHCGRSLFHNRGIVIATRRCYHCGRRAVAEPLEAESLA